MTEAVAPFRKCADVPDLVFLAAIDTVCRERTEPGDRHPWSMASRWDVATVLIGRPDLVGTGYATQDWPGVPPKLVLAKARKLIRRGLITGCLCGCRGDFEITETGAQALAAGGRLQPLGQSIRGALAEMRERHGLGLGIAPAAAAAQEQIWDSFGVPPAMRDVDRYALTALTSVSGGCRRHESGTWIHRAPHDCPRWMRG